MAIDMEAMRSKLKELKTKSSSKDMIWKPEFGDQTIRIVPYKESLDNPFIELYIHYNMGERGFLSPITFDEADPIYEFAQQLKSDPNDRDSYRQARSFEPKKRVYVPVIVRGAESEGIRYWGFGSTVFEQLLSYIADPDYGDITDPMNGRDIVISYSKAEGDNDYPKTSIRVKPNQTKAMEDIPKLKKMIQDQLPITETFKTYSYAELKDKLQNYLVGDSDVSESTSVGGEVTWVEGDSPSTDNPDKSNESSTPKTDVESAFDDLFNA